jgi:anti-sigma B factor antagonist
MARDDDGPAAWVEIERTAAGGVTLQIGGELDLASVEEVREHIDAAMEQSTPAMIIDLGRLTFMDSTGIALLIQVANSVDEIEVRNPSAAVRRVIEVTGLTKRFGMDP